MKGLDQVNVSVTLSLIAAGLLVILLPIAVISTVDSKMNEPVTVHLAGDSTMAEKREDERPETGWGEFLQGWFDETEVRVLNHARNGRSTRTFIEEGRWRGLIDSLNPGDYVFIQFGHNDQSERKADRYTPPDQYRANLVHFVMQARKKSAIPVLLTPVMRRRFDEPGNFYDTHGEYPDLVREVASEFEVPLIDMHRDSEKVLKLYGAAPSKALFLWLRPGEHSNYPEGLQDDTHFSPAGAEVMAGIVAGALRELDIGLDPATRPSGHAIEKETDLGREQGGPHQGGGTTTGYSFFEEAQELGLVFRKRKLHPGSAIGYHLHDKDEIYYVLSGSGELTMNGQTSIVGPGTAILTRPGDSHGLRQLGDDDLVIFIVYGAQTD